MLHYAIGYRLALEAGIGVGSLSTLVCVHGCICCCLQAGFSSLPSMERDGSHNSLTSLGSAATPPAKPPAANTGGSGGSAASAALSHGQLLSV
jgi:hypothetical protein